MILDVGAVPASALGLPWSLCIHNKAASFLPGCKLHQSCPTLGPRNGCFCGPITAILSVGFGAWRKSEPATLSVLHGVIPQTSGTLAGQT